MTESDDLPAFVDLILAVAIASALVVVVFLPEGVPFAATVRLLIGVPFLLIVPGYAVVTALYPRSRPETDGPVGYGNDVGTPTEAVDHRALSAVERITISVPMSLVVVAVVALTSTVTPWGISAVPIVLGVAGVTVTGAAVAAVRRKHVPSRERPGGLSTWQRPVAGSRDRYESVGAVLLDAAVILAVGLAVTALLVQPFGSPGSDGFSEYELLTEDDDGDLVAAGHPDQFTPDGDESVLLRIQNHEGHATEYTVVVKLQRLDESGDTPEVSRSVELDRFTVQADDGGTQVVEHSPDPTMTGEVRLVYLVYKDDVPLHPTRESADGTLQLWITVPEPADE